MRNDVVYDHTPQVPLDEFFPEIAYEFPDAPTGLINHLFLRAIIRLARDGNVLRRKVIVNVQPCVPNYLLEPIDCVDIVAIMSVCGLCDSICQNVVRLVKRPCRDCCGRACWFDPPDQIIFSKGVEGAYEVEISVAPKRDACAVDQILLDAHLDTILDGVRFYLYSMSGKDWASAQRGNEFEQRFVQGIRKHSVDALMGGQRGAIRMSRNRGR